MAEILNILYDYMEGKITEDDVHERVDAVAEYQRDLNMRGIAYNEGI